MKARLNPLLETLYRLMFEDAENDNEEVIVVDKDNQKEDDQSLIDKYTDQVKKSDAVDPVMLASVVTPIPGAVIIGNAYTKAIPKRERAKAYKEIVTHPIKSLVKAPIKIPEAAVKTVLKVPKATYDFGKDVVDKVKHPKKTYKNFKKSIVSSKDSIKNWYNKKKSQKEEL